MKELSFAILFSLFSLTGFSDDLPVHEGVPEKDEDFFYDSENPHYFQPGCSWYCRAYVSEVVASSELKPSKFTYFASHSHDSRSTTAWVEGVEGDGKGEWIAYRFNFDEMSSGGDASYDGTLGITSLLIANGYRKTRKTWEENNRIRLLKMSLDGEPLAMILLKDCFEIQRVTIPKIMLPSEKTTNSAAMTFRFEIVDVYRGTKYRDTALSLLMFDGVGVH